MKKLVRKRRLTEPKRKFNVKLATEEKAITLEEVESLNIDKSMFRKCQSATEYKEDLKKNHKTILKILGKKVYVTNYCPTILRIGHGSKMIEASIIFLKSPIKNQEFMVKMVSNLTRPAKSELIRHSRADAIALKYMINRYPKTPKLDWLDILTKGIGKQAHTELNMARVLNFIAKLSELYPENNLKYSKKISIKPTKVLKK